MRWHVTGADSITGLDTYRDIEADSPERAEQLARDRFGMMVTEVAPAAETTVNAPPTPSQLAGMIQYTPPDYLGISVATFVLGVFAALCYIGGVVGVVNAIAMANEPRAIGIDSPILAVELQHERTVYMLAMGLTSFAVGALLHGAATGLIALRDIAQNSFRR